MNSELLFHEQEMQDSSYPNFSSFVFAIAKGTAPTLHQDPTVSRAVREKESDLRAPLRSNNPLRSPTG